MMYHSSDFLLQSLKEDNITVDDAVKDGANVLVEERNEVAFDVASDSSIERKDDYQWSSLSPKSLNKDSILVVDDEHSSDMHLSGSSGHSENSGSSGATRGNLLQLLNVKRRPLYRSKSISFLPYANNWRSSMKRRCHDDFANPSSKTLRHSTCFRGSNSSCDHSGDLAALRDKHCDLSSSLCKVQAELEALKLTIQVEKDSAVDYKPGTISEMVNELRVAQKQWQSAMMSRLKLSEEIQTDRIKILADRFGYSDNDDTIRKLLLDDSSREDNSLAANKNDDFVHALMDTKDRLDTLRSTYCLPKQPLRCSDEQSISPPETGFVTMTPSASTTPDSCGGPSLFVAPLGPSCSLKGGRCSKGLLSESSFEKTRPTRLTSSSSKSKKPFVYRGRGEKGQGSTKGHRGRRLVAWKAVFNAEAKCRRLERLVALLRKKIRSS